MEENITRAEHEEFRKRMEEQSRRQDRRIELLEEDTRQISALALSVQRLAQSVEIMCKTEEKQNSRLEALEGRDGEKWRRAVSYAVTVIIGAVLGCLLTAAGIG